MSRRISYDPESDQTWFEQYAAAGGQAWRLGKEPEKTMYCITEGWGQPAKIGLSMHLEERWCMIQSHTWRPLYVAWTVRGTGLHESALKYLLRSRKVFGEWFEDSDDSLKLLSAYDPLAMVAHVARREGYPPVLDRRPRARKQPGLPSLPGRTAAA